MKRTIFVVIATLLIFSGFGCGCGSSQNTEANLEHKAMAPAFTAKDHRGSDLVLSELHKEGPVVITFLRSFY